MGLAGDCTDRQTASLCCRNSSLLYYESFNWQLLRRPAVQCVSRALPQLCDVRRMPRSQRASPATPQGPDPLPPTARAPPDTLTAPLVPPRARRKADAGESRRRAFRRPTDGDSPSPVGKVTLRFCGTDCSRPACEGSWGASNTELGVRWEPGPGRGRPRPRDCPTAASLQGRGGPRPGLWKGIPPLDVCHALASLQSG
jgi:hypothetical protein